MKVKKQISKTIRSINLSKNSPPERIISINGNNASLFKENDLLPILDFKNLTADSWLRLMQICTVISLPEITINKKNSDNIGLIVETMEEIKEIKN